MKVIFFARALTAGGSERQLALLARGLAQRGHDVAVAVFYTGGAIEQLLAETGVRLMSLGKRGRWHVIGPLARFCRLLLIERPDIVYAFLPTQTALAALLLPPWLATRLVFGVRAGGMQLVHYDTLTNLSYRLEVLLSRRASLIIANARALRSDAIKRGMPARRIAIVPNGIDTAAMAPDCEQGHAQRRAWGIGDREFVIGMVARLDPMKDHGNLLAAAASFLKLHDDARFVCVGSGPADYRHKLESDARRIGLDGRMIWAGEQNSIKAACNAFDIATLSSAFGEGFPNVLGEAMACGVPVVATDVGDVRVIVGDCGEVVPPREPELLCAAWVRLRQRLASEPGLHAACRARVVENFGVDAMVAKTEAILTALCSGQEPEAIARACV